MDSAIRYGRAAGLRTPIECRAAMRGFVWRHEEGAGVLWRRGRVEGGVLQIFLGGVVGWCGCDGGDLWW